MTLSKINREDVFPSFGSLFDAMFNREMEPVNYAGKGATLPSVNIKETKDEFQLELAAPGLKKEDFKIELNNNTLKISSEKKEEVEEKDEHHRYTRREFRYSSFQRSFNLPEQVELSKISAQYTDGILKVVVPKKQKETNNNATIIQIN